MHKTLIQACLLLLMALSAFAAPTAPADAALEQRALQLAEDLRCLVCQNQTIAESNAQFAVDLRRQVRDQLAAGQEDQQVIDFIVHRYGDFILYRPPVKASTWLLWIGPFLLLAGAAAGLYRVLRRAGEDAADPVAPDDLARAETLLRGAGKEDR